MIHIPHTQKWAAGCDPPLRSEKHTMMDKFKYFKHKKEPAFADSYIKQYDLRGIFDESIIQFLFVSK